MNVSGADASSKANLDSRKNTERIGNVVTSVKTILETFLDDSSLDCDKILDYKGVVVEKTKTNFLLPQPIRDLFEDLAGQKVGGKDKWQVISAAITAFAELSEVTQNDMLRRVRDAEGAGGSFDVLVEQVRRQHAKASAPPPAYKTPAAVNPSRTGVPLADDDPTPRKRRGR